MATFGATILKDQGSNATGIPVPADVIAGLGSGKKPAVKVTLNGYTYRTTVAVMDGVFMLSLSSANREAAGVRAGDKLQVTLELDTEPRTVEVPQELAAALARKRGAREAFDAASYSVRKEFVRQVETARAAETRERRIAAILARLVKS